MKVRRTEVGFVLGFDSNREKLNHEHSLAQAWELMPNFLRVLRREPLILNAKQLFDKQRKEGGHIIPVREALKRSIGCLALIRDGRQKSGRPHCDRFLLATTKLLGFVPYEQVLKEEKDWRKKKCVSEIRDKYIESSSKDAEYRAVRDANMCVAREKKQLAEFFIRYPQFELGWSILNDVARQLMESQPEVNKLEYN
jgi:hypothetical protein